MAADNVEFMRRFYAEHMTVEGQRRLAEGSGHVDDSIAEDCVLVNFDEAPSTAPYYGHDGLRAWVRDNMDAVDNLWVELAEAEDAGDGWVVLTVNFHGQIQGIEADFALHPVSHIRDGQLAYSKGFLQKEDALAAIEEWKRSGVPTA